jgi:diguanylate cyclase (GGDEF)-like protein
VLSSADRLALGTIDVYLPRADRLRPTDTRIADVACHLVSVALERRTSRDRLTHQASHDPLTDLPNREQLSDRLAMALGQAGRQVAVLLCDVDNFKIINDTFGHDVGDCVLIALAERIRASLRPDELPCRLGGDEFAVLIEPVTGLAQAQATAERLLAAVAEPYRVYGREFFVTMSIGIAIAEGGTVAPDRALLEADLAMYEAKSMGKDHHAAFDERLLHGKLERIDLEAELRGAIRRDELTLHYQPVVEAQSGAIRGVEALLRWDRADGRSVPPNTFIPIAEDSGLIVPIGRWVLDRACEQMASWRQIMPGRDLHMSVNVSPRQLERGELVETTRRALDRTGLAPEALVLEITESALADQHSQAAGEVLEQLRRLGVQLSIDDFGTGYSSLGRLRSMAIDELKIDRSFVQEIVGATSDAPLVHAMIAMAHALGRRIVAEGVETRVQLDVLTALGCDLVQGYLLSRPRTADDIEALLALGRIGTLRLVDPPVPSRGR